MRRAFALTAAFLLTFTFGACAAPLETAPVPDFYVALFVRNHLDRDVVIFVDGTEVLQVESGRRVQDFSIPITTEGEGLVEARTVQGAALDLFDVDGPPDFFGQRGFVLNLECGDLWVWVGQMIYVEIAPVINPPPCP